MEIVSEWQGKNPDDYERQIDDERARQTRASGYADIELADIPSGDVVHEAYPAGGGVGGVGGGVGGGGSGGGVEKPRRREERTVTVQNRDLRGLLGGVGFLTVLLIIVVLLFMSYPYRDDEKGRGTTFIFVPSLDVPKDSLFVGHTNPSTASYCAAWAGSTLYRGSYALAGPPSPETSYIIDRYGFDTPPQFSDVYVDKAMPLVLVDHNQASQSPPFVSSFSLPDIAGVVDNHGTQEDFISSSVDYPLSIDIRPWGSVATIIYYHFYERHQTPSKALSRCLLSSIYSDTVGLEGPTTTEHDKMAASLLAPIASTSSRTQLTKSLINSRVPPEDTPINDVLNIDAKTFQLSWEDGSFLTLRWSTFESGDPDFILDRSEEFLEEMRKQKQEDSLDFYFLSVIDQLKFFEEGVVEGISTLLLPSENERNAAGIVFGGRLSEGGSQMDVSPLMSRKKEFLPPLDFLFREIKPFDWGDPYSTGE